MQVAKKINFLEKEKQRLEAEIIEYKTFLLSSEQTIRKLIFLTNNFEALRKRWVDFNIPKALSRAEAVEAKYSNPLDRESNSQYQQDCILLFREMPCTTIAECRATLNQGREEMEQIRKELAVFNTCHANLQPVTVRYQAVCNRLIELKNSLLPNVAGMSL